MLVERGLAGPSGLVGQVLRTVCSRVRANLLSNYLSLAAFTIAFRIFQLCSGLIFSIKNQIPSKVSIGTYPYESFSPNMKTFTATVKKHTCPLKFFEILEDRDFWLQFNEATQIPFTSHFLHILINKFKGEGFFYTFDQHDHLLRRHVWIK